jgi:hypothetical protein
MANTPLCAAFALLALAPAVRSQVIAYDGFAYTSGQSLAAQNGGVGFSGGWQLFSGTASIQPGNLIAASPSDGLVETGNSLSLTPASTSTAAHATRNLSAPIPGVTGSTFWMSVVMKGAGEIGTTGEGKIALLNGTFGFNVETGQGVQGTPPNSGTNANWSVQGPSPFVEGTSSVPNTLQSLLVVKYTFGSANDFIQLFVNPPLGGGAPTTSSAQTSGNHTTNLNTVDLSYTSNNGAANSVLFDEIRIGQTFADVTPTAVPEPSILLLTAAGLSLAIRRRRERRET